MRIPQHLELCTQRLVRAVRSTPRLHVLCAVVAALFILLSGCAKPRPIKYYQITYPSSMSVVPEPVVPVGARVRILTGPLMGIEGTVIRRGKRDQFVAVVNFLGSGATVDLEDWQVEQIPEPGD